MPSSVEYPEEITRRYKVLDLLGEGAMGRVYRVRDRLLQGREAALKLLKPYAADPEAAQWLFKAEFYSMTRLRHPNTVEVWDYGVLPEGQLFLVMELVPGEELAERIARGPLPLEEVYSVLVQLLQALDYIHTRQYLHRDIKAANIRLRPDGTLKLMDFGLTAQTGALGGRAITGTPAYMAPEIPQGGVLGPGADLYAVGCLAFEMLTGRLPFLGSVGEVVRAHLQEAPPSVSQFRSDVPSGLQHLVERLLLKDPQRRPRRASEVLTEIAGIAGVALVRDTKEQQLSFLEAGDLIGRETELETLDAALHQAQEGCGGAWLIGAPAGTGKSRLVRELKLKAQLSGFLVLHGHCLDQGQGPLGALREALRPALALGTPEERQRYEAALRQFFPEFAGAASPPDTADSVGLLMGWLKDLAARQPFLWVMDELHWADPQTLDIFNRGLRELKEARVLCVGTFRDDETPAGSLVWQTLEDGTSHYLPLAALDVAGQAELLQALMPEARVPDAFSQALYEATGGSPLFIREALQVLMEEGHLVRQRGQWRFPRDLAALRELHGVEAALRRRVGHLSPAARQLLEVAAVLGTHLEHHVLALLTHLPEEELFAARELLLTRQLLARADDGLLEFPHARVREVVYAQLVPEDRQRLHAAAAEYLESHDASAHTQDLARHFFQAGLMARAFPYVVQSGYAALRAGATYVAIDYFAQALGLLEHLPGPSLAERLELGLLIGQHGFHLTPERAALGLTVALQAMDADPAQAQALLTRQGRSGVELLTLYAVTHGLIGEPVAALTAADRLQAMLPSGNSPLSALGALSRFGAWWIQGHIDTLVSEARRVAPVLETSFPPGTPPVLTSARVGCFAVQNARIFQGYAPDPVARDKALGYARDLGDEGPFLPWFYFGVWAAWSGRLTEAEAYLERTARKTRQVGGPPFVWLLYLQPYLLWQQGEFELALTQLEKNLLAYPHFRSQALVFGMALGLRGRIMADLGRSTEALAVFEHLLEHAHARQLGLVVMLATYGQADTYLTMGQFSEARAGFEALHALAVSPAQRNPLCEAYALLGLGRCLLAVRDPLARSRLDQALKIVQRPEIDNWFMQANIQRARATLLAETGQSAEAQQALAEAGRLFHTMRNPHGLHQVGLQLAALNHVKPPTVMREISLEARWERFKGLMR
jgi:tetratricopeptide (TPR) repeat protein